MGMIPIVIDSLCLCVCMSVYRSVGWSVCAILTRSLSIIVLSCSIVVGAVVAEKHQSDQRWLANRNELLPTSVSKVREPNTERQRLSNNVK